MIAIRYICPLIYILCIIFSLSIFVRKYFFKTAVFSWITLLLFISNALTMLFYSFMTFSSDVFLSKRFAVYGLISSLIMFSLYITLILNFSIIYNKEHISRKRFDIGNLYYLGIQVITNLNVLLIVLWLCIKPISKFDIKPVMVKTENIVLVYGWVNGGVHSLIVNLMIFIAIFFSFLGFSLIAERRYSHSVKVKNIYLFILIVVSIFVFIVDCILPLCNKAILPPIMPISLCVLFVVMMHIVSKLPIYETLMQILASRIFDTIEDAIIFADADLKIIYANHFANELFERKDLLNKSVYTILPKKFDIENLQYEQTSIIQINTSQKKYLRLKFIPYIDSDGQLIGTILTFQDYTVLMVEYMNLSYEYTDINKKILHKNRQLIQQNNTLQKHINHKNIVQKEYLRLLEVDGLTQAYNRAYFLRVIAEKVEAGDYGFCVFSIDINDFKYINDLTGHWLGDLVLIKITEKLQETLGYDGIVARSDGDNFLLLHNSISDTDEAVLYARIISSVLSEIKTINNFEISITISVGICVYENGMNSDEVVTNAELANMEANLQTNNRYVVFSPETSKIITGKFKLINDIKQGCEKNEFIPIFQPQVLVTKEGSQTIIGYESLARWQHPQRGLLSPYFFIETAESSGSIIHISYSILRQACYRINELRELGFDNFTISVNLSTKQLNSEKFIDTVTNIFNETKVEKKYLEFEITETELLVYNETILKKCITLKKMGIHISIDDFGVGFSSFNYIKSLPIDKIKIDKSFVDGIGKNQRIEEILYIVLEFAKICNLKIVVEGVEQKEQLDFLLRSSDNIIIQGYYFYKPISFEAITKNAVYPLTTPQKLEGV